MKIQITYINTRYSNISVVLKNRTLEAKMTNDDKKILVALGDVLTNVRNWSDNYHQKGSSSTPKKKSYLKSSRIDEMTKSNDEDLNFNLDELIEILDD